MPVARLKRGQSSGEGGPEASAVAACAPITLRKVEGLQSLHVAPAKRYLVHVA